MGVPTFIFGCIIAFVAVVLGFTLFPSVNDTTTGIATTGFGAIHLGLHSLIPYAFLGAVLLIVYLLFKKGSG